MAGQRRPMSWGTSRTAVGLLTAAALILPAPVAMASPESDADNAINQTWEASGGPTSPLGPKDGGVYPVADGFGQNFAGGKIFFTPATGAHIMGGAILDKYQSLGGPADSDLGFPTIDEGPGRVSPDSRNTTFSAGDKPVIFWTPDTGARVVRGAINAAWDKVGGSAGPLGVPVEDETYDGDVVTQRFTGGQLSWNRQTKAFTTVPPELAGQLTGLAVPTDATSAINAARRAAGGPLGPLGAKHGAQYAIGNDGAGQDFAGGKIFFSPATGANVVGGQVLAKYESVGGPLGDLGFPATSEVDGGLPPASRMSTFAAPDKPVIFWTPDYGAVIVRGAMNAAWAKLGGAKGTLGAPVADQTDSGDVVTQRFSGGEVSWNKTGNKFTTNPPNLAAALAGLQVPGQDLPNAPHPSTPNANADKAFTWHWWYWTIVVVAVLLLAALLLGILSRRHHRRDDAAEPAPPAFESVTAGHWSPDTEIEADTSKFSDHDVEMSSYSPSRPAWSDSELRDLAAQWPAGAAIADPPAGGLPHSVVESLDADDPDAVDTTPIPSETAVHEGRHAAPEVGAPPPTGWTLAANGMESGLQEDPVAPRPAIHLPLEDPHQAPLGYPIKGNVQSGVYHTPDSPSYGDAVAEIWFATEELAHVNGFSKGG
jgi:uncharacterized protein with LGFP repeats